MYLPHQSEHPDQRASGNGHSLYAPVTRAVATCTCTCSCNQPSATHAVMYMYNYLSLHITLFSYTITNQQSTLYLTHLRVHLYQYSDETPQMLSCTSLSGHPLPRVTAVSSPACTHCTTR